MDVKEQNFFCNSVKQQDITELCSNKKFSDVKKHITTV